MSLLDVISGATVTAALKRTYFLQASKNAPLGIPRPLFVCDAITEETPEYEFDVSEHPVEAGEETTDHVQPKNPTLRLVGIVSNTPLDLSVSIANAAAAAVAAVTNSQLRSSILNTGASQAASIVGASIMGGSSSAASSALAGGADALARSLLISMAQAKTIFDVVTVRQKYSDMVIEKLSFPRKSGDGYQVAFELELKHMNIVSALVIQLTQLAESVINQATANQDLGGQTTSSVSSQAASAAGGSILTAALKALGG